MDTLAIIVTFQPDVAVLAHLVEVLTPQVDGIILVDNGPDQRVSDWLTNGHPLGVSRLEMSGNVGVATAHNRGMSAARSLGASRVLLFDQDSCPAADLVVRLTDAVNRATSHGWRVAGAGPRFRDPRDGFIHPFIRQRGWRIQRVTTPDHEDFCAADYLITSGCLLSLEVLDEVGFLDDHLFIDYVDIEWGLRAGARGYVHLGVFSARMDHPLGDPPLSILWGQKRIPSHSPLRHYYHFRNALAVYRRGHAPRLWVLNDAFRLALKAVFYSFFVSDCAHQRRAIARGLRDGLRGKLGPFDQEEVSDR